MSYFQPEARLTGRHRSCRRPWCQDLPPPNKVSPEWSGGNRPLKGGLVTVQQVFEVEKAVFRKTHLREGRTTRPSSFVRKVQLDNVKDSLTSIMTLLPLFATATHFSSSNTTLQTDSAVISSRTRWPVFTSQTLTLPSLPPLTTRVSSNCRLVTLLSCAASRWIGHIFSRDQTLTDPSEPPVTSVLPRSCSWPTSDVWP